MQVLSDYGYENDKSEGLSLIKGSLKKWKLRDLTSRWMEFNKF